MTPIQETAPVADVPIDLEVVLDRRMMKIGEILELEIGGVLEMRRSAGENIDLYVGHKLVAFGEIVIIENNMGVRITDFCGDE